jgi:hypothetical protein
VADHRISRDPFAVVRCLAGRGPSSPLMRTASHYRTAFPTRWADSPLAPPDADWRLHRRCLGLAWACPASLENVTAVSIRLPALIQLAGP